MPVWLIVLAAGLYVAGLFAVAWRGDRHARGTDAAPNPFVYALALSVYCTSWTYFGAVGTAASSGWDYLPIYAGPVIVFVFLPGILKRIGEVAHRESISSLADFLSARYGKSRGVGALAALAAVMGSLPYIALQLKSVGMSFQALAYGAENAGGQPASETVLLTALAMAVFAILFGARQSDATRRNSGLMHVLALEAVIKLVALVAVSLMSMTVIMADPAAIPKAAYEPFTHLEIDTRLITMTLLSMCAIICLPRQFHVTVIERKTDAERHFARFVFPLYLILTSAVVIPITVAGIATIKEGVPPDLYVMDLPLASGDGLLAMLVFLGGFSAATGMVIVACVALSTMVTNDLIVPAVMQTGRFASLGGDSGARLTTIRRSVIVVLVLLAYGYYRLAGTGEALAQIGLLSFAAAAQFAPSLIGAVYWRGGRRAGVLAGLAIGMVVWAYTLFLPAILSHDRMAAALPGWLDPYALFGMRFEDSLTHGALWSLGANLAAYVLVSLRARERLRDKVQAGAFVGGTDLPLQVESGSGASVSSVTPNGLKTLAARFLTPEAVDHAFADFERTTGVPASGDGPADWQLVQRTERLLASALGASSARVVLASAIGGSQVALPDVLSMLDHKTQAERFERHMLQSMLENISQGISVVDSEQRLVAWNTAYLELFDYPHDLVAVGTPVERLIEYNLRSGWIEGNPADEARRRVEHMRAGRQHTYERRNPDGRYLRITGHPMPGGGYVTTFTDITTDKLRERALIEANETLESRVRERTHDLEVMADDLDVARREAEGANASKTRFLAAASHDLLQPLNAARLFLGSISSDKKGMDLVSKADKSIQSADELLRGLLDISRLDHGNITAKPVTIPLGPLLEDLVDEAMPMAELAGLEMRIAPTSLVVQADPDFLKSVRRNFISNARRYTRKGGVLVGARRRGNVAQIEVWDTGPGIAPDRLDLIFEEFRRYEDADNAGIRGAGLGLSVSKRLADLMGAAIHVRSKPGKGSVFSVRVPLAITKPVRRKAAASTASRKKAPLTGLRILVIDDEPAIVDAMRALLGSWGCDVAGAGSDVEADARFTSEEFDAVIADLHLQGERDGLGLIEQYRKRLPAPGNALLLTATATDEVKARAQAAGVAVLRKPAGPDDIRRFLEGLKATGRTHAAE
ncbi:MAG TPA: PAS domain-containing hybrid sensor histidine kinase/response regulator [Hyphomonas sp.]|nr:hybrid sensor histidine kinase/response regulator [Hyphomonas sp.]MCB9961771.1 hybrid sensor histidine kinase/response regulator [Hyphomonas sp.]MCB9972734.1 hybrid sensor histidine kinase/response regulator [Hyphomonas sp.]MCC0017502.1 hybrid sensor histidine kinase/response regulator [Rhodobiaceae bacterium]HPE47727.1 PAS domain-containing hybrid sensor histidine kinase/response regulator [Hyphomonas sp.]